MHIPRTTAQIAKAGLFHVTRRKLELQASILKHLAKNATDCYNYKRDQESKKKVPDSSVMVLYNASIKSMDDLYRLIYP